MSNPVLFWIAFNIFILLMLVLDLGVFHRKAHAIKIREALLWTTFWISLALLFNVGVYFVRGPVKALEFFTGYLIEYSLSVDNLFVFLLIFNYFKVPHHYQYNVLFWGIIGAVIARLAFIVLGVALIHWFHWILYVFGAFLIVTGIKMATHRGEEIHPENNPVLIVLKKIMPVTHHYEKGKFFVKTDRRFFATPLFVTLVFIDIMDVVFAVDSIPAIFSITLDPMIVYSSNVFAILGLRSLYFALSGMIQLFHFLHYGLAIILTFVGVKMLIADFYKIPVPIALGTIALVLLLSMLASVIWPREGRLPEPPREPLGS